MHHGMIDYLACLLGNFKIPGLWTCLKGIGCTATKTFRFAWGPLYRVHHTVDLTNGSVHLLQCDIYML